MRCLLLLSFAAAPTERSWTSASPRPLGADLRVPHPGQAARESVDCAFALPQTPQNGRIFFFQVKTRGGEVPESPGGCKIWSTTGNGGRGIMRSFVVRCA